VSRIRSKTANWTIAVSKVQKLRLDKGLTQVQLAKKIGVNKGTVQKWEQEGRGQETIARIARLCKVLECSVEDLIDD